MTNPSPTARGVRDSAPPSDPSETAAAALAARVLHRTLAALYAAGHQGATYRAIGERVDAPYQHVGEWCQELSGRSPKLTKVLRMGVKIAPAVLRALAVEVEAQSGTVHDLRDVALGFQVKAGEYAACVRAALADDHLDADEDRALEATELEVEAQIAASRAARAQRRARGGAAR